MGSLFEIFALAVLGYWQFSDDVTGEWWMSRRAAASLPCPRLGALSLDPPLPGTWDLSILSVYGPHTALVVALPLNASGQAF